LAIPVLVLLGAGFVIATYVHAAQYREVGFVFDFDLRVTRKAPPGIPLGDRFIGIEGRPPFRSAGDAVWRLQELEPGQTYPFRFEHATIPIQVTRTPLLPKALISGATYLAVTIMTLVIARRRRKQREAGVMAGAVYLGFIVAFGFARLTVMIAEPALFCVFAAFNAITMPLLLDLFLRFPVPKPWLARRPFRFAYAYIPKIVINTLTCVAFLTLHRDPSELHLSRVLKLGHVMGGMDVVYAVLCIGAMIHTLITAAAQMRKQAQWIVFGLFASAAAAGVLFMMGTRSSFYERVFAGNDSMVLAYGILACTMAFAFVEFRLIDVDRIVNRSLVYVLLSGAVAGVYLVAAGLLGLTLGNVLGMQSQLVTVVSTVVSTALFFPLRRAVQNNVDRVFFRERYRYTQTVREMAGELVTILDLDRLLRRLLDAAMRDVGIAHGLVILADDAGDPELITKAGEPPTPDLGRIGPLAGTMLSRIRQKAHRGLVALRTAYEDDPELVRIFDALSARALVFLVSQGEPLGLVALGPKRSGMLMTRDDVELFEALVPQTAVAVRNARAYRHIEQLSRDLAKQRDEILRLQARLADENLYLREALRGVTGGEMIGAAPSWKTAVETAHRVAPTDTTVLLLGESGTGKEGLARMVHDHSPRRSERPLVVVDCAAIPEHLIESELFGHEKGAFTGAVARRRGRFEVADGGTLFLDEIGELPLPLQAKLLRVLQEHEFQRVGGTDTIKVDVRVLAATNRDLEAEVRAGRFREDLYYRLAVVPIRLPPLRERREDIPRLVQHFAEKFARRAGKGVVGVSESAMTRLLAYRWPGNVRELRNVMERAVALAEGRVLDPEITIGVDVPAPQPAPTPVEEEQPAAAAGGAPIPFHEAVDDARRQIIADAIAKAGGNRAEAARILGLQRTYLYRLEKQLGLR
jgi:two-component system response regulator HydG